VPKGIWVENFLKKVFHHTPFQKLIVRNANGKSIVSRGAELGLAKKATLPPAKVLRRNSKPCTKKPRSACRQQRGHGSEVTCARVAPQHCPILMQQEYHNKRSKVMQEGKRFFP
jgi:hypothetical protein